MNGDAYEESTHSRAKLGLAVLTSPSAAFEEIIRRRLLGTALAIAAVAGTLSVIPPVIAGTHSGPLQFLQIGKTNPLVWLGLLGLYAAVLWRILKWLGSDIGYANVLTVMGWAQVSLALAQLAFIGREIGVIAGSDGVGNFLGSLGAVLQLVYVAVIAVGLQAAAGVAILRGALVYVVVAASAFIAFGLTYGNARFGPFASAPLGIQSTASMVIGVDQSPWIAAGGVGLLLALWLLAREMQWPVSRRNSAMAVAGGISAGLLAVYLMVLLRTDYYGELLTAQRLYKQNRHTEAALQMRSLLPISRNNAELMLEIGHTYFAAGDDALARRYYNRALEAARAGKLPQQEQFSAMAHTGLGMVADFRGDYTEALREFDLARKLSPELREPWIRAAVTLNRAARYDEAIKSANHAVRELESDSAVAWAALAQAFVNKGDAKQAQAALAMVSSRDKALFERIGPDAEDWRSAADRFTRQDLEFPLEKELFRANPSVSRPDSKKTSGSRGK